MSDEGAKAKGPTVAEMDAATTEIALLERLNDASGELLRKTMNDKADLLRNLTVTQERCTELLLENREIRKRYAETVGMNPPVDLLVRKVKP